MKKYLLVFSIMAAIALSFNFAFAIGDDWREDCLNMMSDQSSYGGMMRGFGMMDDQGPYNMMNWGGEGMGFWGVVSMILAIILWVIFWSIVIVAIIALVRWIYLRVFRGELWIFGKKETAEDILKMRYAKGEINKEQYESMKKEISK